MPCSIVVSYVVCPGHNEPDDKDATNVKYRDPPERPTDRDWDVLTRILCLTDCHTNEFRADVRKHGIGERAPKAEENGKVRVVHLRQQV